MDLICQIIYTSQMAENNHNFAKHKHVRIDNLFRKAKFLAFLRLDDLPE